MARFRAMKDMARTTEEKVEAMMPTVPADMPDYPYGLCISLTEAELEKLGLDDECEVGDMIHLFAMAQVTSVSKTQNDGGNCCRIELQVTHLGCEDEDTETAEEAAGEDEEAE